MNKKANNQVKPADYVHLHNHTHYSLLDGLQKVGEMVARARELGMEAIAMTDHGTLSGAIEFYQEATKAGIKPIIGMEAYIAPRTHTDKDGKQDANPFHLTVLAMNKQGYKNLMRLSTIASLEGFYYKPRIDRTLLEQYNEGLIVLSGCMNGELSDALRRGQDKQARQVAEWYSRVFGDRYYLELQDHGAEWEEQKRVNDQLADLGHELDIPLVVTADAHYTYKEDQDAHEVLLCVQTGSELSDEKRMSLKDMHLFLSDPMEIAKRWRHMPEVLTNTRKIADRCDVELEFGKILIPKFDVPAGETEKSYLEKLTYQGLAWRYGGKSLGGTRKLSIGEAKKLLPPPVLERAEYELGVINKMEFAGFFLIFWDLVKWGKDKGIVFGPGRGSAAGSIVSYALDVTDLDPLEYDLLFERFLNPDRISMPDIDIDIMDTRRDEVIEYVAEKYGHDRVANIVTFGTMAARNAIRDVARVLGVAYANADRLAKMVPPPQQGRHTPLAEHIKKVAELTEEYKSNAESKQVIDLAIRLEGTIRSHGVHAAGVVIAPDDIVEYVPLELAQKGVVATQYSMYPIEELGLLKMDFLGLANLTIIRNAIRIIRKVHGNEINISKIPLDDAKTFELLGEGGTTGVFQLESSGMRRYLKLLQPTVFDDIVAMVALYRPGPMQWIDDFIERKHGRKKIEYQHPVMEAALENTHGIIVYQEQVMQISKDMCGFTGGQSDTLRKAIGKKIPELMAKMKTEFIEGGLKTVDTTKKDMEKFWSQLEDFAAYCFNKSHAACYALIAYWTAYLKANYPSAFMAALMTSEFEDSDKIARDVADCRHMGIEVLPPDINESFVEFAVIPKTGQIRFALAAVKNVGVGAVEKILEVRDTGGSFKSMADFIKRVPASVINRKTMESLIKAGAFDRFEERGTLLHNLDAIVSFGSKLEKEATTNQVGLFATGSKSEDPTLNDLQLAESPEPIAEREQLQWERELLGLYLSKHPLEDFEQWLGENTKPLGKITANMEGRRVTVGGIVTSVRKILTRNGANMAFVAIEDMSDSLELIVFPKAYEASPDLWQTDKVLVAKGKVSSKDREGRTGGEIKILVDEAEELTPSTLRNTKSNFSQSSSQPPSANGPRPSEKPASNQTSPIEIKVPDTNDAAKLNQLKHLLSRHPGGTEVVVVVNDTTRIKLPVRVAPTDELRQHLENLYNRESIAIPA